jgi:hypothetical protein
MEVCSQIYALATLSPGNIPSTLWIRGWMDPTAIVDDPKKEYFAPAGSRTTIRRTSIL